MPLTLERLVYISRAKPAAFTTVAIAEVLGQSRTNNDCRNITGALALGDHEFLQALEGHRQELDGLLDRLTRDARHFELTVLGRVVVPIRIFEGWAMKGPMGSDAIDRFFPDARAGRLTSEEIAATLALL